MAKIFIGLGGIGTGILLRMKKKMEACRGVKEKIERSYIRKYG